VLTLSASAILVMVHDADADLELEQVPHPASAGGMLKLGDPLGEVEACRGICGGVSRP
jgi:hypothetical protein